MNTTTTTVADLDLPPDPERHNDNRAAWAATALNAFADVTMMNTAGEDGETILGDLLADLMHWCDRNGVDFNDMLERARDHYEEETRPEE